MALLDFLKPPAPAVSRRTAKRTVYEMRIKELEAKLSSGLLDERAKQDALLGFLREFLLEFFGVAAKSTMEALAQIEASQTDLRARNRAATLYKSTVQYEKMGIPLGERELKDMLTTLKEILYFV
jgi:hypothetical protein